MAEVLGAPIGPAVAVVAETGPAGEVLAVRPEPSGVVVPERASAVPARV